MGEIELWRTLRTPCKVTVIELGPSPAAERIPAAAQARARLGVAGKFGDSAGQ
jgi:hypothetical protein